jgi:hypothetical protein
MSNVFRRTGAVFVAIGGLLIGACGSPSGPSAISSVKPTQSEELRQSSARGDSSGLTSSALSEGLSDVTLAKAGWACIQPGNGLTLCAPPGKGLPPIPPTGEGHPTYDLMAFTLDHQFVHRIKLMRPDLYHGQPCLGGDPWSYLAIIDYYECIVPAQG